MGPFRYDAWSDWTDTALNFDRRYVGDVVLISSEAFMRIGHSVACLLLAIGGGQLAMSLHGRRGPGSGRGDAEVGDGVIDERLREALPAPGPPSPPSAGSHPGVS
jgi:hypothetical protein